MRPPVARQMRLLPIRLIAALKITHILLKSEVLLVVVIFVVVVVVVRLDFDVVGSGHDESENVVAVVVSVCVACPKSTNLNQYKVFLLVNVDVVGLSTVDDVTG